MILPTSKTDRLIARIFLWAFVADMIILPAVFVKIFILYPVTPVVAATRYDNKGTALRDIVVGPATGYFMQQLKNRSFTPVVVGKITRLPLTVDGALITLNGDNIQVFEYPDHAAALKNATSFARIYAASSHRSALKESLHVYANDTLV